LQFAERCSCEDNLSPRELRQPSPPKANAGENREGDCSRVFGKIWGQAVRVQEGSGWRPDDSGVLPNLCVEATSPGCCGSRQVHLPILRECWSSGRPHHPTSRGWA